MGAASAIAATPTAATPATAAPAYCATMASLRVPAFDHEGRPVQFDTWLDDLQLYLLSDIKDGVSLFDHVSEAATAPPTTADSATRSQWLSHDADTHLAIRNHLPLAECAHFERAGQHRHFEDLVSHLCASHARYHAAVPVEFLDRDQPPMFITLYFIVTRLPDSLRSVRDHFLSLDPTSLTVDLLKQHLLAAEASAVVVGAARGTPGPPFFEGCSPSPLAPSYASAAAADVSVAEDVGAASASVKRRSGKGKGGKGGGGGSGGVEVAAGVVVGAAVEVVAAVGLVEEVGALVAVVEAAVGVAAVAAVGLVAVGLELGVLVLEVASVSSSNVGARPRRPSSFVSGFYVGHLWVVARMSFAQFFCDSTTLTPLSTPVLVRMADPSGGPVVARSSNVLPFSGGSVRLTDRSSPPFVLCELGECVTICTCIRTGRHLATFTRWPGSSMYTLATKPPQVAASPQVSASGQVAASCSCRLLSHQILLWHHRLDHPSLPRLRDIHFRLLVSGLPRSLPPLPPLPTPPCLPCVEGRQHAAPHSSSFPPTTAPLQTLHMDVWGPARVSGQSRERYFLLVVDDYTRYTTVFPLRSKGHVIDVLIPWIRTVRLQLRERFCQNLPVLCLHSDKGGEFSSRLFSTSGPVSPCGRPRPHCVGRGRLAMRQGSESGDTSADKLSPHALPCVFLGFVPDAPGWQFYHPTSRHVFPSQDVTFDESIPFYRLFPYRSASPPPPPLFPAPGPPPVAVGSGDARGAASGGAGPWGAASGGARPGGAESEGAETGGIEPGGVEPGGAEPGGAEPEGVEPEGSASEGAESGGSCWCNPTVCIRLVVRVRACVCAWNGMRA
ncbi:unnamed protein product [Closterium sp. NIES-54]